MPHLLTLSLALLLATPDTRGGRCPISGKEGDPEISLFSQGRVLAFCCEKCRERFRKERENSLSAEEVREGGELVFNGKDLTGFQAPTRTGKWETRDGILTGFGGPGVLGTKKSFDNFVLSMDARVHDTGTRRGNSGVFIRSSGLTAFRNRWPDGPEIQIDNGDPEYWTGAIWKKARAKKVKTKDKGWLHLRIEAQGKRIRVWVDGELVTDFTQAEAVRKGPIALQVHHPTDVVEFKNVKVRSLRTR